MPNSPITILSWDAPEFRHYQKNPAWYITMIIIMTLLVIYQIIQKDYFGATCLVFIAIFIAYFGSRQPKIINISITDQGIIFDNTLIPYSRIQHFWVIDDGTHKALNIETSAYINNQLHIELADQDAEEVRDVLLELLPEHTETNPTVAQRIAHRFRF